MTLTVPDQWFELHRFSNDITLVREPHVLQGAYANMWHVRGRDSDLLLDSGMGVLSLREHVVELTERPVICVASHTHYDHIGGHHEFEERVCHRKEADILESADPMKTVLGRRAQTPFDAIPYEGFDITKYAIRGARPTRLVEDGDDIDLGNRHFEVMHLPGHSPGSIVLWEGVTRTLISGDVVYDGELLDDLYHSEVDDYIESFEKIRNLEVDIVHPGHFDSFGRPRFREIVDDYLGGKRKPECPNG